MNIRAAVLVAALCAACGDEATDGAGGGTGGGGAGEGGGGSGGDGGTGGSGGDAEGTLTWTEGRSLPTAVDHHGTVLHNGYLFVIGGATDRVPTITNVQVGRLGDDGDIAEWTTTTPVPRALGGQSTRVLNGRIYLAGGIVMVGHTAVEAIDTVLSAAVNDNGTLGDWREEEPLPDTRFHHGSFVHDGALYVLGGKERQPGGTPQEEVWRAVPGDDGVISEWQALRPLPAGVTHHTVVLHGGKVWVIGGYKAGNGTDEPVSDIVVSTLAADGTLGEWSVQGELPSHRATSAPVVLGDTLLLLGGLRGATATIQDSVLKTTFTATGLGEFERLTDLPIGRGHLHEAPVHNGRIYAIGGQMQDRSSARVVHIGSFE